MASLRVNLGGRLIKGRENSLLERLSVGLGPILHPLYALSCSRWLHYVQLF